MLSPVNRLPNSKTNEVNHMEQRSTTDGDVAAPDPIASGALQVSGPVKVTSSDGKTVGKISLGLQSGSGPVDLGRAEYQVYTPTDLRVAGPNSPAVHYTWVPSSGTPDTVLGPNETVTIELDTGAMGFTAHPLLANNLFTIEVRPPIGTSLVIRRTVPPTLKAGSSSECY
jgi:archaellin